MTRIRRLSLFDAPKIKKMISFLGNDEAERFIKVLMNNSYNILHNILPLKYKCLPESYVLIEYKKLHGMITVIPQKGNPYKFSITKLLFDQNYYDAGKQLIDFIVTKYGAEGVETFQALIDESHDELMQLFVKGCGFRQASSEVLYKLTKKIHRTNKNDNIIFRPFKNSDTEEVCNIYNSTVNTLYKPSQLKNKNEFKEIMLQGLISSYELNYVMEDKARKKILAYFSIVTFDNINYTLKLTLQEGFDTDLSIIFGFVTRELIRRKRNFNLFVKVKKYIKNYETIENYLIKKEAVKIQTKNLLIKDFYKPVKESQKSLKMILFNESSQNIVSN